MIDTKYFEIIPDFDCTECMEEIQISESTLSQYDSFHEFVEETLGSFANRPISDDQQDDPDDHHSSKPLWRLHLFTFPSMKRSMIIFRFHHCIADGITFGTIWNRLIDHDHDQKDVDSKSASNPKVESKPDTFSAVNMFKTGIMVLIQWMLFLVGSIYVFFKMTIFAVRCCSKVHVHFEGHIHSLSMSTNPTSRYRANRRRSSSARSVNVNS